MPDPTWSRPPRARPPTARSAGVVEVTVGALLQVERNEVMSYRGAALPIVRLSRLFGLPEATSDRLHLFVVGAGGAAIGIARLLRLDADRREGGAGGEGLQYLSNMTPLTRFVSYAAFVTIAGQLIFLVNLVWSVAKGRKASDNPWEATTLEWIIPSPPHPR